jgi:hypothetical protein
MKMELIIIKNKLFHPYDRRSFIKRILGYCNCPNHKRHWFIYPSTIHMNTRYSDEKDNWITCCEEFYGNEIAPGIKELWEEYYNSRF